LKAYRKYFLNKLVWFAITFVCAFLLNFILPRLMPGDPVAAIVARQAQGMSNTAGVQAIYEQYTELFGTTRPIAEQFFIYTRNVLRGDFGFSFRTRKPVLEEIGQRLPNTIYLMTITMLGAVLIAIPIGIISAIRQYSSFDIAVTTFSFAGQAIPEFWLGLLLILIFYAWLKNPFTGGPLLPSGGMISVGAVGFNLGDRIVHLILPVMTGSLGWIAWYSRFLRSSMLDVIHQDYLRTARAKGLPNRVVIYKHALRNALIPLITLLALDLPYIFSGAIFVEILFSWPGMGRLYYQAALQRDYPILLAVLIIGASFIIFSNLLADLLYAFLDPRVRYD